jgi:hypothetical protein
MCWSTTKKTLHACQCIQSCSLHNINHCETNQWRDVISTRSVYSYCSTHTVSNQYYRRWVCAIKGPYNITNVPREEQVFSWSYIKLSISTLAVMCNTSDYARNSSLFCEYWITQELSIPNMRERKQWISNISLCSATI